MTRENKILGSAVIASLITRKSILGAISCSCTMIFVCSFVLFSFVSCGNDSSQKSAAQPTTPPPLNPDAPDMTGLTGPWLYTNGPWIKKLSSGNHTIRGIAIPDLQVCEWQQTPYIGGIIGILDKVTNTNDGWYPNTIRLTIWPDGESIIGEPGWIPDPDDYYLNYLKPATDYCASKGLYFIIDWHWIGNYNTSYADQQTKDFWAYIAPKYANNPYAIFELFNEPILPNNWDIWKSVAQDWVDLIRNHAPYNLILVGGPYWSSDCSGSVMNPITGGNIVYTCHIYPPTSWDEYDQRFGNAALYRPIVMTEWAFEHPDPNAPLATALSGDAEVVDGIQSFDPRYGPAPGTPPSNGYGDHYKEYLEARPNIGWTYWCADNQWQSMFDENWNLRGTNYFSGEFVKQWLLEKHNSAN